MSFEINKQNDFSVISIESENRFTIIVAFLMVLLIAFIAILAQGFSQLLTEKVNIIFIIFFALFCWVAYYNFFNFFYMASGDELIEIHSDFLIHKKKVWKLKHTNKYKKSKIKDIMISDKSRLVSSSSLAMFGLSDIHIKFKYGRKTKLVGKKITQEEAKMILMEFAKFGYII